MVEFGMMFGVIFRGFVIMGSLAYVIKLAHIPFNQILVL
jgi:preprotein translocase subunit Sss1